MQAASCRPLNGGQFPLEYAAHHGRVALTKLLLQVPKCAVCRLQLLAASSAHRQARADPNVYGQKAVIWVLKRWPPGFRVTLIGMAMLTGWLSLVIEDLENSNCGPETLHGVGRQAGKTGKCKRKM